MNRHTLDRVHLILLILWIVVGLPLSWVLKESIPWVVFLSVYAIIATHAAGLHRYSEEDSDD